MGTESHPVWTLYDRIRSTRLSCKYYGRRLRRLERHNFWLEVILGVSASTAVASSVVWKTAVGQGVWQALTFVAALVAVVKPMLHLTKKMKEFESQLSAYRLLEAEFLEVKAAVEQRQKFDGTMQAEVKRIIGRERALVAKNPDSVEDATLLNKCWQEVLRELPTESFYIPEGE